MNHDTTACAFPALTADFLHNSECLIDNIVADLWKQVGMNTLLQRCGFRKRSGVDVNSVLYCLTMWVWLKSNSVSLFARDSLRTFCAAGKDVLYEAMNREDWNWRSLHLRVARKALQQLTVPGSATAFVLDDTIKIRSGKKMPGVSSHFDHTTGRHVMGQQVLALGLSCAQGFVPIDSELFTGQTNVVGLPAPFKDGRSIAAQRHRAALNQTKPEMARTMIARALREGIYAQYLLADAWFGTKPMIALAEDALLTPIVRMKKNKMKYRHSLYMPDKVICKEMDLCALYQSAVRGQWEKIPGQNYQSKTVVVDLNLNDPKDEKARWIKVRLLFVQGMPASDKALPGKHDWCVFLTTDVNLNPQKMLELYAMRWAIEVYFKESKQHLGFLQEQARHYACYIASIHLTAIRFCLLVIAKQQHDVSSVAQMRQQIVGNATQIDFASRLWGCCFRSLMVGALDELRPVLGDKVDLVLQTIDLHVQRFFMQALQLEPLQLRLETA
jgi:SRSO17 transposase